MLPRSAASAPVNMTVWIAVETILIRRKQTRKMQTESKTNITVPYIDSENLYKDGLNPETARSAAIDLRASADITIFPHKTELVKTSLNIAIPEGYVGLVCSRSGLALKKSVFVLNAPGVVDADYRGEVGVILCNLGSEDFFIKKGERIAQLMIVPYVMPAYIRVESLENTERGSGGFGSTGR